MSTIGALFWERVAEGPDRAAVLAEDGELTYRQLGDRAAAVASTLGDRRGQRVGLLLDHGPDTLTGILGALTAGATYVPLDPQYPVDRLAAMLADADAGTVLVGAAHRELAADLLTRAGRPDTQLLDPSALPAVTPAPANDSDEDDPAYILYTSGSTGVPKGVVQTHRNALFQIRTHIDNLRIGPADRVSVLSSFSFDMAVTDTFSALLSGAAVVPVDLRTTGLAGLAEILAARGVTIYHSTPTVYRYLLAALEQRPAAGGLTSVRVIVLGGEQVVRDDLDRYRRHFAGGCVFVNGYGATEISFAVQNHLTAVDVDAGRGTGDGVVPIGFPLAGVEVEVRADTGEIVIGSRYLASYWRDPERNAQRFTEAGGGVRRYRTGDQGRWLPDGRLAYLGRLDRQVKVRGHRVELGELEAALVALPEVAQAAVVATEVAGPVGPETRLTAYVRAAPGTTVAPSPLRAALAGVLPDYALPQEIVPMAEFPLTSTGKVNRLALAAIPRPRRPVNDMSIVDGTAAVVAAAWRAALGWADVPVRDNFFDLGGHSLLMAQVQESLERSLGRRIPLTTLYGYPTIESLATHLDGTAAADRDGVRGAADRMARRRLSRGGRAN